MSAHASVSRAGTPETDRILREAERVILGKPRTLRLALACLLARGHLLIEDRPGVGKTTLALVLARLFGLDFRRIQFTSDLLPADVIGATIYERQAERFRFQPGPIFTQVVLADEVNRATPKAQSALLEAMEERQVTTDGTTRALPEPFFVIATQNPGDQLGTFPLPESQLDRFLMRVDIGDPDPAAERELLRGRDRRELIREAPPASTPDALAGLQRAVGRVHASDALIAYVQALLAQTRRTPGLVHGLSPRAGQALLHAARAWALLDGREAVLPEDVQAVFTAVAAHRLQGRDHDRAPTAESLLSAVAIP
ncbi:AAA family ATPase [Aquisalimonas lutea]|uniref:AAA family ATPase n=1 Tax=Aquisalimonas lutea TaxID=1327750 RepID=UPI0025B3BC0B|nr:AAA family ATPase [Aquisalimonas lutea]MDN3518345.1 AAA family ATPase [Aquisalimonas lutea]